MNRTFVIALNGLAATALVATGSVALAAPEPAGSAGASATAAELPIVAAKASANDGNGPANAIDGDLATRWSAAGDGVWIRFDLGSVTTVASVSLAWYEGDNRKSTFDVQLSENGSKWSTVLSGETSSGTTLSPEAYDFAKGSARYVRVVGHGNSSPDSSQWTSITEATVSGSTTDDPPPQTPGPGGVETPPGAVLVDDQSSTYTIDSGGSATDPKVYDCQENTIQGGVVIEADNVVLQNCYVDAQQQYGIYSDNSNNVTIQNNDIKGITPSGDGDLNAITFFGNGTKIQYNTAIDFVDGDPGDSHTDFIQTWVSDSHPIASDDVEVRFNIATGPDNPDHDPGIPSIHQFVMAEDYGQGGNDGGDTDGMRNWIVADNEIGDSWNQAIKLDGPDEVAITRNKFIGSSDYAMEVTDASSDVTFYSDNEVGPDYGEIGMPVTPGPGPE